MKLSVPLWCAQGPGRRDARGIKGTPTAPTKISALLRTGRDDTGFHGLVHVRTVLRGEIDNRARSYHGTNLAGRGRTTARAVSRKGLPSRPRDKKRPLVCLDEFCKQLSPTPANQSRRAPTTSRKGAACAVPSWPTARWSAGVACISGRRAAQHWTHSIKWLCDEVYPNVAKIVLVQDNLNTHLTSFQEPRLFNPDCINCDLA